MKLNSPELAHLPYLAEIWHDASHITQQEMVNRGSNFEIAEVVYFDYHHEGNPFHQLFFIAGLCGKKMI